MEAPTAAVHPVLVELDGSLVRFDGLPLHPMIVHAPVVLLPLVAAGLVAVLVRPSLRPVLGPVTVLLAVGAMATSFLAVWSGEQLGEALGRGDELDRHERWGVLTRMFASLVALGALAFALLDRYLTTRRPVVTGVGAVAALLAVASVVTVSIAGHAGAKLAWEGAILQIDGSVDGDGSATSVPGVPSSTTGGTAGTVPTDTGPSATGAPPAAQPELPGTGTPGVDVVLGEWDLVTSVEAAPSGVITFRFRNLGTVAHALRIRTTGSGGDRLEWRSEQVAPGETGLLVAELAPGTYELDCPIEDEFGEHDALGMEALFRVGDDAPPLEPLPSINPPLSSAPPATAAPPPDPPPGGGTPAPPAAGTMTVDVRAFAFEPAILRVPAGTTVVWTNLDRAPHTATGDTFDTGILGQGTTGSIRFDTPGTYDYLCTIHPAMRGTIIVDP